MESTEASSADELDEFRSMSFQEAVMSAENTPEWLIEGIVGASSTLLYGEAKVGKSFLVSALIAALTTGTDFLGKPVPQDRDFNVAVCWTDDAGPNEYGKRINEVIPEEFSPNVTFYELPLMRTPDMWDRLHLKIVSAGHNVVIVDNLAQCLHGSINQDDVVRSFFEGIRMFTRDGFPVIVVAHSTDKAGATGFKSDKPMGSAVISQSVRWRIFASRSRQGNMKLKFMGNLAEPYEMTIKHVGPGARFTVVGTEKEKSERNRSKEVLDRNKEMADYIKEHHPGGTKREQARALESKFGGSQETYRKWLKPRGTIGVLLQAG